MDQQDQSTNQNLAQTQKGMRVGKELIKATVPFTEGSVIRSWLHVCSTFALLLMALLGAGLSPWWPLQLLFSLLTSLMMVRMFITYHDYMHRAILVKSRLAWILFRVYSALSLTPPRSWNSSHNHHHGHVGKITASIIGAFPIMSTQMWREASWASRAEYRFVRHPLTLVTGYITIFFFSVTLLPLIRNPRKHWDSLLSLLGHVLLIATLWFFGGFETAFWVVILPMSISSALGSYLFFAQHCFKDMHVLSADSWTFYKAAMETSSYMRLNKVMQWFTGNIGFHHVHHLNVRIPFYRLPEAMKAIPELQAPVTTSLRPRDILDCFKCCLWDEDQQTMVSYREAARLAAA